MLNKPYLSIQEMLEKTETQRKQVETELDSFHSWHPEQASILSYQKPEDYMLLKQSLQGIPLQEFLAKSGTTGIGGGAYLVPDAIHTKLQIYVKETDICPVISAVMVNGWKGGGDLKVDIVNDETLGAKEFSSGATMETETIETKQATITPVNFAKAPRITQDLIEDNAFDLVDFHLKKAAQVLGKKASDLALTVLCTATDGWGTVNSSATGDADETKFSGGATADVMDAIRGIGDDLWLANTMIITPEAFGHSVGLFVSSVGWANPSTPADPLFAFKLADLDVVKSTSPVLHAATDVAGATMTNCITLLFDRNNALLTARKRWLEINNYNDPVKDIAGMTITCRQDSVTLYNDAIYKLTET